MPKRIFGCIQARMGSERLPGKVIKPLCSKPIIEHIIDRLNAVEEISGIILATTIDPRNDALEEIAKEKDILIYRCPDENDIALRLKGCFELAACDALLKVNADCPLVDPRVMSLMAKSYAGDNSLDYISNRIKYTFPLGLSCELISKTAINWCNDNLKTPEEREYATNKIKNSPDLFKAKSIEHEEDLSHLNLCIDTQEDLDLLEEIFKKYYSDDPHFGLDKIKEYFS